MILSWTRIGFSPIRWIRVDAIDPDDRTFDLFRSAGMANPILVESVDKDSFRILCGFHRYQAANFLDWEDLPARILKDSASNWIAFKHIFWIKAYRTDPHPVELAGIIKLAKCLHLPTRSSLQDILAPLGYFLPDHLFSLLRKLSDFPQDLGRLFLQYPLSFRQVERFVLLSPQVLQKLAVWGEVLRMRTPELLEIGEQLESLFQTVSKTRQQEWLGDVVARVLDPDRPRDERLLYLKTQLDQVVRPVLHTFRRKKRDAHRQLNMPEGMNVSWDKDLEREDVTISLSVKHPDDLDGFQSTLTDPAFKEGIAKLLVSHE